MHWADILEDFQVIFKLQLGKRTTLTTFHYSVVIYRPPKHQLYERQISTLLIWVGFFFLISWLGFHILSPADGKVTKLTTILCQLQISEISVMKVWHSLMVWFLYRILSTGWICMSFNLYVDWSLNSLLDWYVYCK